MLVKYECNDTLHVFRIKEIDIIKMHLTAIFSKFYSSTCSKRIDMNYSDLEILPAFLISFPILIGAISFPMLVRASNSCQLMRDSRNTAHIEKSRWCS